MDTVGLLPWPDPCLLLHRLSFYSGHSSFGMYCMMFLAVSAMPWASCGCRKVESPPLALVPWGTAVL